MLMLYNKEEGKAVLCQDSSVVDNECPEGYTCCNKAEKLYHRVFEHNGHYYTIHVGTNHFDILKSKETNEMAKYRYSVTYHHTKDTFDRFDLSYTWAYWNDDYEDVYTHLTVLIDCILDNSVLRSTPMERINFMLYNKTGEGASVVCQDSSIVDNECPEGYTCCNQAEKLYHRVIEHQGQYYTIHIGKRKHLEFLKSKETTKYSYSVFYHNNKEMFDRFDSSYTWAYFNDDYEDVYKNLTALLDSLLPSVITVC